MAKRLCIGGPLDGQKIEVLDGQAFFAAPGELELLYTRRRFMAVGGKGHVEVYAPVESHYEIQAPSELTMPAANKEIVGGGSLSNLAPTFALDRAGFWHKLGPIMIHAAVMLIGALVLGICVLGFFRALWQPTPRGPKADSSMGGGIIGPGPDHYSGGGGGGGEGGHGGH